MANLKGLIFEIDDKILFWDKKNFEELVASFSDEEINELIFQLDHLDYFDIGYDYWEDYPSIEDRNYDVIKNYINRWFFSCVDCGDFSKADELYEYVKAIC